MGADCSVRVIWYQWGCGFFGNMLWQGAATLIYFLLAFVPLYLWARGRYEKSRVQAFAQSLVGICWAFLVSTGYPLWAWFESRSFEHWVVTIDIALRADQRAYFKLMMDCAKNFWTAVLATYTIAGLWGVAMKESPTKPGVAGAGT